MNGGTPLQLEAFLQDMAEKTGTRVRTSPAGGAETGFRAEFCGQEYALWIDGADEEAMQRASLVKYLLSHALAGHAAGDRQSYLRSILLGEGDAGYAFRYMTKYNVADGACLVLDVVPDRLIGECFALAERSFADTADMVVRMDDTRFAVVHFLEEGQSPYEFGCFLHQSLYEELGVRASVGVGCETRSFSEAGVSYEQAAAAVRMSAIFDRAGEVHTYREYLLMHVLEGASEARLRGYLEQFRIGGLEDVFGDEDMMNTAERFLECSLNISEAARALFMHRNTLMYRLDKIERATGLNIRKFSDAVTFRVITIIYKCR